MRKTVILLVLEPVAVAATDDIHAYDPAASGGEARGKLVEIAAVAGEAVHAHDEVAALGISPLGIGDAVEPVGPEAEEVVQAGFCGHCL